MGINAYKPHVLVLVEDNANRDIANGFLLDPNVKARNIQVLSSSGGWSKVREDFLKTHVDGLRKYQNRYLVLLIDFDGKVTDRMAYFRQGIPDDVQDRVYLLGTRNEPEPLKKQYGDSLENIGKALAAECFRDETKLWAHDLLAHNENERKRLNERVKSILFSCA
ncbi:MAG: hypothetical protein Q8O33_04945 [Pseudomonadota bacterium]|nr:hypothetical protein [Pseudomonadota bacterium]